MRVPMRLSWANTLRLKAAIRYRSQYGVSEHVSMQIVHGWKLRRVKAFVNMPRYTIVSA